MRACEAIVVFPCSKSVLLAMRGGLLSATMGPAEGSVKEMRARYCISARLPEIDAGCYALAGTYGRAVEPASTRFWAPGGER